MQKAKELTDAEYEEQQANLPTKEQAELLSDIVKDILKKYHYDENYLFVIACKNGRLINGGMQLIHIEHLLLAFVQILVSQKTPVERLSSILAEGIMLGIKELTNAD